MVWGIRRMSCSNAHLSRIAVIVWAVAVQIWIFQNIWRQKQCKEHIIKYRIGGDGGVWPSPASLLFHRHHSGISFDCANKRKLRGSAASRTIAGSVSIPKKYIFFYYFELSSSSATEKPFYFLSHTRSALAASSVYYWKRSFSDSVRLQIYIHPHAIDA